MFSCLFFVAVCVFCFVLMCLGIVVFFVVSFFAFCYVFACSVFRRFLCLCVGRFLFCVRSCFSKAL